MSAWNRRAFALGVAALFVPAAGHAAEDDPAAVVATIYRRAAAGTGTSGGQFLWVKSRDRRAAFTGRTAALWDRAEAATAKGDQAPPGFDPVTVSQDPSLKLFRVTLEEAGPDRAQVLVSLTGHQSSTPYATVRYHLMRERDRWLIDDISSRPKGEEPWSIRKILQASLPSSEAPRRGTSAPVGPIPDRRDQR